MSHSANWSLSSDDKAPDHQAPWLLMIETDYVWMKPIAAPQAESKALSIAFPFGYITPQAPILEVMR
jgi:hypothetical protein